MPRYFFHVDDGNSTRDGEGLYLADIEVAKCEAIKMAGRIICDAAADFWGRSEWSMTVTNEVGLALFTLQVVGTEAPASQRPAIPRHTSS
jgi:hypothetical protein